MEKIRAGRNRTLTLSSVAQKEYFNKCINITKSTKAEDIIDKTINGDTLEVVKYLPKNFVDLLIVDPPYNLDKNYHGNDFKKMSSGDYKAYTHDWISRIIPILKPTASVYVCCDWRTSIIIGQVLLEYFNVQNRITWQREKGRGALSNWKNAMEDIWFATCSKEYTFNVEDVKIRRKVLAPYRVEGKPKDWEETEHGNFRNTYPSNFWDDISIPYWSMPENTDHPTQKPEKLIAKLILASSNTGDVVFDPFLGSGTTSVVAKKLGRHFVGIELNDTYCAWAEKRLEMADGDTSIQGYNDHIFWERNTLNAQPKQKSKVQIDEQIGIVQP